MKISVIIPTLNEEHYIGNLLDDLSEQTIKPFEILVVDCGSQDATQRIVLKKSGSTLLKASSPVGNQRHYGAKKAKGDMLIFLDADVRLEKNTLGKLVKEMKKEQLDCACPQYIPYPGSLGIRLFYGFFNVLFKLSEKHKPSGAGSCICVTKSLYVKTKGFEKDHVFDDLAFIRNAAQKGAFRMVDVKIGVSDRRIRTYGLLTVVKQYAKLSYYFARDDMRNANAVAYEFGKHKKPLGTSQ